MFENPFLIATIVAFGIIAVPAAIASLIIGWAYVCMRVTNEDQFWLGALMSISPVLIILWVLIAFFSGL